MPEIESFIAYSNELKAFILSEMDDPFIQKLALEIPDLNLELKKKKRKSGLFAAMTTVVGFAAGSMVREKQQIAALKEDI